MTEHIIVIDDRELAGYRTYLVAAHRDPNGDHITSTQASWDIRLALRLPQVEAEALAAALARRPAAKYRTYAAAPLSEALAVEVMAAIMVERAADAGACTEDDLIANGFPPAIISRLGTTARGIAARRA